MYKIGILFQDREFEHDIYELIRAFYPGSEICSFYEEEEAGCDLYFRIEKQGDSCVIRYEDHENKGVDKCRVYRRAVFGCPYFLCGC